MLATAFAAFRPHLVITPRVEKCLPGLFQKPCGHGQTDSHLPPPARAWIDSTSLPSRRHEDRPHDSFGGIDDADESHLREASGSLAPIAALFTVLALCCSDA